MWNGKWPDSFNEDPARLKWVPTGCLQPLADALKLVGKQLVMPRGADRILFWAAPLLSFAPVAICLLPIPFGPHLLGLNVNLGLLLVLAFSGLNVLALCLAGWGSNNKYALTGRGPCRGPVRCL